VLGRFLEVSVRAPDILASLAFYESLGFVQARVGDTRTHPYAVITDGRLSLGLHTNEFLSPALTWVHPDLAPHAADLEALGIELDFSWLGENALHEIGFRDPSGQQVTLIEARTFSSPPATDLQPSSIGYFEEYGMSVADLARTTAFWDSLGFVAFDPEHVPFTRVVASHRDLNLGLYDTDLRNPVLTFSDAQMPERIAMLRDQGYRMPDRLPRGMDPRENALLEAPEGTWLLLTTAID
jgi:catechol 2,3-dioxygenase-like lactoylglutathione lyase family enzyme